MVCAAPTDAIRLDGREHPALLLAQCRKECPHLLVVLLVRLIGFGQAERAVALI
jgi:hypothetical protein